MLFAPHQMLFIVTEQGEFCGACTHKANVVSHKVHVQSQSSLVTIFWPGAHLSSFNTGRYQGQTSFYFALGQRFFQVFLHASFRKLAWGKIFRLSCIRHQMLQNSTSVRHPSSKPPAGTESLLHGSSIHPTANETVDFIITINHHHH